MQSLGETSNIYVCILLVVRILSSFGIFDPAEYAPGASATYVTP